MRPGLLPGVIRQPPPALLALIARLRPWWPLVSFASGVGSFLLVERKERLAGLLADLLLLSWLWLLVEPQLARWRGYPLSARLACWLTQAVHQETLFFVLPFLGHTTDWSSPQALFTVTVGLAGLATIIDPFYEHQLRARRGRYLCFHAFAAGLATLACAPIVFHLDTASSYTLALLIAPLTALPGLLRQRSSTRPLRRPLITVLLVLLAWIAQPWVPPVTLWLDRALLSATLDGREPGTPLDTVTPAQLQRGLYAWSSLHAPLGLKEPIWHVWRHRGQVIDRIALTLEGTSRGRYRTWSRKSAFPSDALGPWSVTLETRGGQRIGRLDFSVVAGR